MKKSFFAAICGLLAVLLINCATEAIMISNSYDYDYASQQEEIIRRRDMKPEWFEKEQNRRDWVDKNNKNDTILFFFGENTRTNAEVDAAGLSTWTAAQAADVVYQDILRQIAVLIDNETKYSSEDFVSEEEMTDNVSETQISGQNRRTQAQVTSSQRTRSQVRTEFSSQVESRSAARYRGLSLEGIYTETWAQDIKKKRIIVNRVWQVYSITRADIVEAQREIARERQQAINEEQRAQILRKQEEELFANLVSEYRVALDGIRQIDFLQTEAEVQFRERYNELLYINSRLKLLPTLQSRNDDIGREYSDFIVEIGNEISKNNPSERYLRYIENMHRQIVYKDGVIDELRNRGAAGQGYNIRSQTYILSFPQRPNETRVSSVNIYAANEMVTNMDYISFSSINGRSNFSRGEYGLNSPAISVSWNEAALYCNWLSRLYGYTPCYTESSGQITAYDKTRNGYRLPERNEIIAILASQSVIINEAEFTRIGIWSSDGGLSEPTVYILSDGPGQMSERYRIMSLGRDNNDWEIGFRVIRNAE